MAGANDNRKSRAEASERMQTREEKRALNRKLQRVSRLKENAEREEGTMVKIDSMLGTMVFKNATNDNINWN